MVTVSELLERFAEPRWVAYRAWHAVAPYWRYGPAQQNAFLAGFDAFASEADVDTAHTRWTAQTRNHDGEALEKAFRGGHAAAMARAWELLPPADRDMERSYGSGSPYFPLFVTGFCRACGTDDSIVNDAGNCAYCEGPILVGRDFDTVEEARS